MPLEASSGSPVMEQISLRVMADQVRIRVLEGVNNLARSAAASADGVEVRHIVEDRVRGHQARGDVQCARRDPQIVGVGGIGEGMPGERTSEAKLCDGWRRERFGYRQDVRPEPRTRGGDDD